LRLSSEHWRCQITTDHRSDKHQNVKISREKLRAETGRKPAKNKREAAERPARRRNMPKLKTNKAAAKRFHTTGTGKITHPKMNKQHILGKKSPKRKRKLRRAGLVDQSNMKQVRRMLPYA